MVDNIVLLRDFCENELLVKEVSLHLVRTSLNINAIYFSHSETMLFQVLEFFFNE